MALDIKKVEYYDIAVEDHASEGFKLLSLFAGVSLWRRSLFETGRLRKSCGGFGDVMGWATWCGAATELIVGWLGESKGYSIRRD